MTESDTTTTCIRRLKASPLLTERKLIFISSATSLFCCHDHLRVGGHSEQIVTNYEYKIVGTPRICLPKLDWMHVLNFISVLNNMDYVCVLISVVSTLWHDYND